MSLKNKTAYIVFCLFVVCVLYTISASGEFGPDRDSNAQTLDAIIAVVGDDVITGRELHRATQQALRQFERNRKAPLPAPEVIQRQVLERLIVDRLQTQAARERAITIDDASLNEAVNLIANRNKISLDQLRQLVERDGMSFSDYRDQIRRELMGNRLRQREVDRRIQVTEQEIDNVMQSSLGGYEYRLAQIVVPIADSADSASLVSAREKSEALLASLQGGADFARLAAAESAGREALEGGELGWRSRNQLPALFADTVVALAPGEVSTPVQSPSGFHLIKLLERRAAEVSGSEAEVREQVHQQLLRRKSEEQWEAWLQRLRAESYVEIR